MKCCSLVLAAVAVPAGSGMVKYFCTPQRCVSLLLLLQGREASTLSTLAFTAPAKGYLPSLGSLYSQPPCFCLSILAVAWHPSESPAPRGLQSALGILLLLLQLPPPLPGQGGSGKTGHLCTPQWWIPPLLLWEEGASGPWAPQLLAFTALTEQGYPCLSILLLPSTLLKA